MILALLTVVGNLPLLAAIVGHIRAHRILDELDDIDRITEGFGTTWHDPTPPTPLRAVAWPARQSPTDMANATLAHPRLRVAYEPPWSPPNWAVDMFAIIVEFDRALEAELVMAA